MKNWIKDRLSEQSTWSGIIKLAGAFGVVVSPDVAMAISVVAAALAANGLHGVVTRG